ncbi:MAG TPA: DUF2723 domain-containing protein [Gemmatimonadaceae bacterium]|nr:DUF2723 domain-containing protein [Gemmatimonadaceae bacterium]
MSDAAAVAPRDSGRRAAAIVFAALLLLYAATLAPRVTFWDAGEFIAAIESFGVPHPPGTPLYVTLGRAWRVALGFVPAALAVNLLSAVCTAAACAIAAGLLARRCRSTLAGVAAGVCGGCMSSVWLDATEAEVYSVALLLSALMLAVGLRAREVDVGLATANGATRRRWRTLLAYLFALAAPLHASALVAGPAAAFAATDAPDAPARERWLAASPLALAFVASAGLATGRWLVAFLALALLLALPAVTGRAALATLLAVLAGASPLVIMLIRARFDPAVNQGNPASLAVLADVIARKQYDVAAPWPRQAPAWLQLANFFQYADWQVALGLAPESTPSILRLLLSLGFVALGVSGARAHRRLDRAGFRAMVVLMLCASLGVLAYLNLKAGPSIGWGILPDSAPHEARERDYFFALAFWGWGLWAGLGAISVARSFVAGRRATVVGLAIALLPALLNWRAMNRRREPDASAAAMLADAMLGSAPRDAVLIVWGDNDSYPLWEAQQARGVRRDVLVVTSPLLGAEWMRRELVRRAGIDPGPARPERSMVAAVARGARERGRGVAFAVTVPADVREAAGGKWVHCGLAWIEPRAACGYADSTRVARFLDARPPTRFTDATVRTMLRPLRCGAVHLGTGTVRVASDSLAQSCNAR